MICKKCGQELPSGAKFCTNCGEKIEETSEFKVCPKCGAKCKKDAKFCTTCGYAFGGNVNVNSGDGKIGAAIKKPSNKKSSNM